jgi:gamma-tubulin complex component 2
MTRSRNYQVRALASDTRTYLELTSYAAIDALALDYRVKFPLSLVISRQTIVRYQVLFRFLIQLKHVEQALCNMWIEHKSGPWRARLTGAGGVGGGGGGEDQRTFQEWRRRVFVLRAKMLAFVQHVIAFAVHDVLEPNGRMLEAKLARVRTVDELLRDHVDFLDSCLKGCMLTTTKLLKVRVHFLSGS